MTGACLFGWHRFGLPRMDAQGELRYECVRYLQVKRSPLRIGLDASKRATADALLAVKVAELTASGEWAGTPSNDSVVQLRVVH